MYTDLNGLILIGGKSTRMGMDKAFIQYHGKSQIQHLYELMIEVIPQTFISVHREQIVNFTDQLIEDTFDVKGPLNGLLSAHQAFPMKAWMVLAVDLPFVTRSTIEKLIASRNQSMMATSFVVSTDGLPEPLAAIWEPKALAKLTKHHESGEGIYPRKFLIDNQVKKVPIMEEHELFNVNNKMDFERVKSMIKSKK